MRCLLRNKISFCYSLFVDKIPIADEFGNETGEYAIQYGEPVKMTANVSAASGAAQSEQFGTSLQYDKVIVTDDMDCLIDENSVLFVDVEPSYRDDGSPIYDYIVKRVAKSLNSISYAIRKVEVS